ncbi:MAG: N-acetylmuramoyl-L-alanine amidase [Sphingopyxis sp.]
MIDWTSKGFSRHKGRVIELLLLICAIAGFGPAHAGTLDSVDVQGTEMILHFSSPGGEAAGFVLDGPRRIAVDVAGHEPGPPVLASSDTILRVRQGRLAGLGLRIVVDLAGPTIVNNLRYSPDGRTLTVSLGSSSANDFAEAVRAGSRTLASPVGGLPTLAMARTPQRRYQVSVPIGNGRGGLPLPSIAGPNDPALPLVVIDAGHGGHDPGAISGNGQLREAHVTLAIARRVRDALVASGRVRVALTRDSDRYLVLEERYGLARRMNADLFMSIHADAAENTSATGASIYTLSEVASDREAGRLAARENRSNILNGIDLGGQSDDVRSILIDLTQRESMNLSSDFARTLQRTGGADIPFRNASHRFAGFVVLKAPDMPSVLLETGFITNPTDAQRLASAEGQAAIARGVRQAVLTHFARRIAQGNNTIVAANAAQ